MLHHLRVFVDLKSVVQCRTSDLYCNTLISVRPDFSLNKEQIMRCSFLIYYSFTIYLFLIYRVSVKLLYSLTS